ncbi:MAG: hypothetical protein DLM68_04775 [Hyphomicrobiales bacterium]|nr:MAG: hypothetical protein DLM68_04775 [Hyphomicrobiales bacterium]
MSKFKLDPPRVIQTAPQLIVANGHTSGSDFWQCYLAGPEANADPAAWRTELNQPLLAVKAG